MHGDFARTVRTVHAATGAAHRLATETPVPGPDRYRPLAKAWLDGHVPLTLLMDLSMPDGPRSAELLAAEPGPAVARRRRPDPATTR